MRAENRFCSITSLVAPGLPIVPVKIYANEISNLLYAIENLCPYRHNISHSDPTLTLHIYTCAPKYNIVRKFKNYFTQRKICVPSDTT